MKKLYTFPIALFCFTIFPSLLNAQAEISGAYIDYSCVGQDSFQIMLHVTVDCKSSGSFSQTITATPACTTISPVPVLLSVQDSFDRTTGCPGRCSPCTDTACSLPYGFKEYVLTGLVDLGGLACDEFTFSWQEAHRNSQITTGGANQGIYVYATLNKALAPCNSTSALRALEPALLCKEQCFSFYEDALDPDGDSLIYSMVPARISALQDIVYLSPYGPLKPLYFNAFPNPTLPWNPPLCRGFHLDSFSGTLQFRPMQPQVAVMVYKIEEYRNGQKIGERVKDFLLPVIDCEDENAPTIGGINGSSSYKTQRCAASIITFTINSDDADTTDTLFMDWDGGIAGASFTVNNGRKPTGTFTWTPDSADATSVPYSFNVTVRDDRCLISHTVTQSFEIIVRPLPVAQYEIVDLGNGLFDFRITNLIPSDAAIEWQIDSPHVITSRYNEYQYTSEGNYDLVLKIIGDCGIKIYRDVLIVDSITGIVEPLSRNNHIRLYPNPAHEKTIIEFDQHGFEPYFIQMINSEGRIVRKWVQRNPGELIISQDELANGIYLLKFRNERGQSWQAKLIFE